MISNALPKSLQDNPRLDRWLAFLPGGTVRLSVGKVEIGQGILTALAQIAAEELSVGLGRMAVVAGDTERAPDEGMTTGSMSIEMSGASVRLVCAEVAALFRAAAARRLGCAESALAVEDGRFVAGGRPSGLDYWALAGAVSLARDVTARAPARPVAAHRVVGTDAPRLDLPAKLAGGGFLHDMTLPGMRHARVLHPPRAWARLAGVDEAAIARAGAAFVRRGEFAAVVADSEAAAMAALAVARPRWEGGPPLTPAMQEAAWLVGQPATLNRFGATGEPSERERVSARYTRPYISHGTLGPSVAVARCDGARLEVWSHTQGVYPLRRHLAALTGLAEAAIVVHHAQGAGCYGHNGADDAAAEAALLAAMRPGAPVRVQWTREDEFAHEPVGSAMAIDIAAALDASGRPADWTTTIWSAPHTARAHPLTLLAARALAEGPRDGPDFVDPPPEAGGGASRNAIPLYDIPGQRLRVHLVQRPPVRTSALRGLGALPNVFAIEGFLDELAERAGVDPLAYRLALLPDPRARRVLETAAGLGGWARRGAAAAGRGLGLGFARYKNRSAYAAVVAAVEVEREVRLTGLWCAADAGLVINPDGARNQLEGGMIQAASMALKEQVRIGPDGIESRTWGGYPILRFSDIPPIRSVLIDAAEHPPLGMGECTMGPTAAAIGNAVAHALGVRIRDMPLTRERIAAALGAG
jgi:CO/xanthine dehydrogenase Mo-binding subunit